MILDATDIAIMLEIRDFKLEGEADILSTICLKKIIRLLVKNSVKVINNFVKKNVRMHNGIQDKEKLKVASLASAVRCMLNR
jgi:hypothetical protein